MRIGSTCILGLVLGEHEIACAQVAGRPGRQRVERLGRFAIPAGASLEKPEDLGQQLQAFLLNHGFSATRAVVGVPAKWLIAEQDKIPPADSAQALAVLRLRAERLALGDDCQLVFDFVGTPNPEEPSQVLLVGILRRRLEEVQKLCNAAGLHLDAITATSLTFAVLLGQIGRGAVVVLSRQGAEVVCQGTGGPSMLRHVSMAEPSSGGDAAERLGSELRRVLMLSSVGAASGQLMLLDDLGMPADQLEELSKRLGIDSGKPPNLDALGTQVDPKALNGDVSPRPAQSYLPAVALAVSASSRLSNMLDFLHPRLAPPRRTPVGRPALLAGIAAVLVVVLGAATFTRVRQLEAQAAELEQRADAMRPDVEAAEARIERTRFGRGFFQTRTPVLECLRQVTQAFPADSSIWTSGFTFRENGRGQIQGKATNQLAVLRVLDRLKASPAFSHAQLMDLREATGDAGKVSFSIGFDFSGQEGP